MQIHRTVLLLSIALLQCIATTCENAVEPDQVEDDGAIFCEHDGVIYCNSFESPADTAGGYGFGQVEFRTDTPPEGGNQSLFVSGGCIVPHFVLDLAPVDEDCYLKLRCWGKDLAIGGGVSLLWEDEDHQQYGAIGFLVSDTVWTAYETEDTLSCPAAHTLSVRFISGGLAPSAMLVDLVEVIRIE